MYVSISELKRTVTDYQLGLLLYLQRGSKIVTNEGTYFRAWMESENKEDKSVIVRKDVADKMYTLGLIEPTEGHFKPHFYYTLSTKANELLSTISEVRLQKVKYKLKLA